MVLAKMLIFVVGTVEGISASSHWHSRRERSDFSLPSREAIGRILMRPSEAHQLHDPVLLDSISLTRKFLATAKAGALIKHIGPIFRSGGGFMPNANILTYSSLSNNYPAPPSNGGALIGGMCKSYENQCAIRLSRALDSAGLSLEKSGYSDPTCAADGITHGRGAESLANFLWRKIGIPERDFLCKDDAKFKNRKGIIFFKDIDGGALDHIDLWDGKSTIGYNGFNNCKEVWFWSLPRTI